MEVLDGTTTSMGGRVDGACGDAVTSRPGHHTTACPRLRRAHDRASRERPRRLDEASTPISAIGRKRSLLDEFKPHLHERFNAGCTDAARLTREIVGLGYCGSDKTVRRYLQELLCKRVIHTV